MSIYWAPLRGDPSAGGPLAFGVRCTARIAPPAWARGEEERGARGREARPHGLQRPLSVCLHVSTKITLKNFLPPLNKFFFLRVVGDMTSGLVFVFFKQADPRASPRTAFLIFPFVLARGVFPLAQIPCG